MKYFLFKFFYCDQTMSPDSGTPVPANLNDFYYFFQREVVTPRLFLEIIWHFPPKDMKKYPKKYTKVKNSSDLVGVGFLKFLEERK